MAGKEKTEKEGRSRIGSVEKYSRQIWLAGLGAYSKISNDGSKLFENLVKDGEKAEKQAALIKEPVKATKSRVGDVKNLALGKWSELEGAFDKRLNSAISRLGVPSRNEVRELHQKVDLLTRHIEKLTGASVAVKAPSSRPAAKISAKPLVKAASKPVATKKPATPQAIAASPASAEASHPQIPQ